MTTTQTVTHLERRKIEAAVLVPMIQAFQRAFGKERANEVAREVIRELARQDGSRWAGQFGRDLAALPERGALIHCSRDFAMAEGFSGELELKRTQTLMQGASHCDFRFKRKA